ncbi:MAG TPA: hypothetical protein VIS73_06135, partial [Rhodocyclaceae bacterium]
TSITVSTRSRARFLILLAGVTSAFLVACGGGGSTQPAGLAASLQPEDGAVAYVAMAEVSTVVSTAATGPGYELVWANTPGGVSVATDAADNVYSVLWDYNRAGDIYLTKRNVDGVLQWEVRFDNTDLSRHEVATWVDTDSQGNVLVSGTIRSGYSKPVNANSVLMKFAPDGRLLWRQVYATDFDGSSTRKLLIDNADNVYVLGLGRSPSGQRTTVRKFRSDGSTEWDWFDPVGIGNPLNFKWAADGDLVIAARTYFGSLNGYAKVDRSGSTVWALSAFYSPTAGDAAGDAAGNTYLINGSDSATGSVLRKLGPGGATLWERTHSLAGLRVEVGSDNSPVVSGFPNRVTAGAAFVKFDPSGNLLWANLDADGPGVALLAHSQMRLDSLNNAYLVAGNLSQMGVTKVLSDGSSAWTALVPFGYGYGMAFGSNQQVFVAGGTVARIDQAGGGDLPPPPPPTEASADLALSLSDSPDPVRSKEALVITATIENHGPSAATRVNFGAMLPEGETLLSVVTSNGSCSGNTVISCALDTIAFGEVATVTMTLHVAHTSGILTTTASVNASEIDPVVGNNTAQVTTQVVKPRRFRPRR